MTTIPNVTPPSAAAWRQWLEKNHHKETKVHLIKYKVHTGKPTIKAQEAMDEAICFGWIDTTVKRLDDERYQQTFVKRNKNANWSNNTLKHAERLIKAGKMTPPGLAAYKAGKKKGPFDDKNRYDFPPELKKALTKEPAAKTFYNKLPPSSKKIYHAMINTAKTAPTKEKRIQEALTLLKNNIKNPYAGK